MSGPLLAEGGSRRRGVAFVVLIVVCLVLLAASDSGPVQEFRRGVNFAVAPVQNSLSDGTRSVTRVLGAFAEIDTLRHENLALQGRVDVLEDELVVLETVRDENRRLERVLQTRNALDHETVAAKVSARQATQFERGLTLDRGQEVGIVVGDPVLSDGGALVGRVIDVGEGYSSVRLINDTRSLITGLDRRSRATGDVIGRLTAPLAMTDIAFTPTDSVEIGDVVITAGIELGKRFKSFYPKGLPIGRVIAVEQEPGSIVQTALVEPAANLDGLETVLVITDHTGPRRAPEQSAGES
jgi:rod shape-determining protein MreC